MVEPPPGRRRAGPQRALRRCRHCASGPLAWGVQFHVEVEPGTVPKWAAVPEYERTLTEHPRAVHSLLAGGGADVTSPP